MTSAPLLRFADLKARNIVPNRTTLMRWIEHADFPPGRKLGFGRNGTRAWTTEEIDAWLESRSLASHGEAA